MITTPGRLALKDIAELAEVSRPAVSNWRKRYGDFPAPVEESTPRKPLFDADAVVAWLKRNDFFPEGAEQKLRLASLWAVANLLRTVVPIDDIPLVMLTLLARDKNPAFVPSAEFTELAAEISPDTVEEVRQGIASLKLADYGQAARLVVDRFLGVGSRGDRSQYGTISSLSSTTVVAAAATTAADAGTVLDPACGIAGTLLGVGDHAPNAKLLGVDIGRYTATLARLVVYLTGKEATIVTGDSLTADPFADVRADLVVCEPPLGGRFSRDDREQLQRSFPGYSLGGLGYDDLFLLYGSQHLAAGGRAYIITSLHPTFRRQFKEHRQHLTAQGRIEAVVELPPGLFSATRIPAVLWVLSAGDTTEPLLIDASKQPPRSVPTRIADWLTAARRGEATDVRYKAVTLADVVTNDGSLTPSTYLAEPIDADEARSAFDTAIQSLATSTKELMHLRTPRVTADAIPTSTTSTTLGKLIQEGHFERIIGTHERDEELKSGAAYLARSRRDGAPSFVDDFDSDDVLRPGDILLPRIGTTAWVHEDDGKTWVPSNMVTVLRPTSDEYDPHFIVACLTAPANAETRGTMPRHLPISRITIPELKRAERAVIADTARSLSTAQSAARQLAQEIEHANNALVNLVFAGK